MALVLKDRVKETTTTTGTGAITLAGAATNFQTFTSVLSNADTTYYAIIDDTNGAFEVGLGTFASSGTTLTRTTVLESSNSGSAVNLGSGTKQVFMTYPAEKSVFLDASNQLVINGSSVTSSVAELNILDGKSFVDEAGMDSNSATAIASQQSIKAYVDAQLTAQDLDIQGDSGGALSIDLDSETLTIAGGTGISTSGSSNTITINGDDASTSSKGIASFSSDDFSVSSGAVTIKASGITNTQLAGSIANSKLSNSSVNFGGVSLALGASDTTPAFDLSDATSYPTSSLSGTITNAQLAGSIADSKLSTITTAGKVDIGALEIDGATDIGADLVDADLVIVDDGANGTERKSTLTRVKKYIYSATSGDATASDSGAITLAAAQTNVTSLLATDIKIGEDDQTKIDFETADEIHFYAANAEQVYVSDGVFGPQTDSDVDLGTTGVRWKNAFIDTVTSTTFTGALTGTASLVAVTDSTANTNFPVVFHDESNALLDDTGALRYNPSTGELLVPKLTVAGTTTVVDTVTMNAANAIVFEGATADAHETTLSIVDPTADHTQYLINQGGYIPVLAVATTTAITSTPAELNIMDGDTSASSTTVADADRVVLNDNGTMKQVAVTDLSAYFDDEITAMPNLVTTAATTVGALNSGSITSGFGNINTGSSTITTTGAVATGALTAGGILKTDDTTEATSTTDGSLQTDGGLSVVKDAVFGDDVKLLSDAAVLNFGADSDVTLTHVADTALLLNSSRQLQFGDSGTYIHQSADGVLDLVSDTEVEINGTTIDINGDLDISGTTTQTGVSTSAAKDIFNAGMSVKNGTTSAGFIEFFEDSDNGTNKVTLIGPSSTSDITLTLPSSAGTIATNTSAADEATALAIALG